MLACWPPGPPLRVTRHVSAAPSRRRPPGVTSSSTTGSCPTAPTVRRRVVRGPRHASLGPPARATRPFGRRTASLSPDPSPRTPFADHDVWAWCTAPLRSRRKPWHPRGTTRVPIRPAGAVVRLREQLHADLRIPRRAGRHRRSARRARRHDAVPHPGARPGRRARRPRRHRPGPDRFRQDPRLRHPDPRPGRGRRSPPSRRAGAGADPRAGRADHRRAGPAGRGGRCPRGRRLRRRSDATADLGAQPWPRRPRRHARPPDRPHPP